MPLNSSSLVQYEVPTFDKEWKPVTKRAIYTGLLSGVGSYFLLGETGSSNILNTSVPAAVAVGAACAGGSVASDLLSDYVIKNLGQNESLATAESLLVKTAISGGATVGVLKVASGIEPSLLAFGVGAASKVGGDAIFNQVDPMILGMLF